jgi:hypothetical protein
MLEFIIVIALLAFLCTDAGAVTVGTLFAIVAGFFVGRQRADSAAGKFIRWHRDTRRDIFKR